MLVSTKMITGFNTDVRYDGHVYHVQTEDGGKDNPIMESLVYIGGTIVAKKLTPYPDRLNAADGYEGLASLLKRQHQVIIAAIRAGRIKDLIRHSLKQQAGNNAQETEPIVSLPGVPHELITTSDQAPPPSLPLAMSELSPEPEVATDAVAPIPPAGSVPLENVGPAGTSKPIWPSARVSNGLNVSARPSSSRGETAGLNLDQVLADYVKRGGGQAKLDVKVLTPEVFTAGKGIGLRVQVTNEAKPDVDATVTVKIIGTAFKPQVFIGRAGRDGVASFNLTLPSFSTGTAAIVIEAQSGTGRGELKNLIRRA